ncbi:MAG TPA: 2Fe-2S iron-sulfur cluster-binding protein [Candidatus Aminicenantes bacterium]|nr:2Fe-2S iron-sulfur cluster-binding protein [Candidatus Aminicenantes bacterium]
MKLTIDGREVECRSGATILEAARGAGIRIPALCDHPGLEPFAGCRICLVEVSGRGGFVPACATPAEDGQVVRTRTPEVLALRKRMLEFILAQHPYACLVCPEKASCDDLKSTIRKTGEVTGCVLCPENGDCELQRVADEVGLDRVDLPASYRNLEVHREDPFFDRDYNLCILCGRCVRVCEEVRGAAVLSFIHRGGRTEVGTAFGRPLLDSGCRFCGACVDICPTGSLIERAVRPQPAATGSAEIVCPFCAQGCVLTLRTRDGRVLDAVPADAEPNRRQACVKGRFLVRGALGGAGRIREPHVLKDGRLVPATLDEALDRASSGLLAAAEGRRALVYPSQVPLEDAFLFLEFGREVLGAGTVVPSPAPEVEMALEAFEARHGLPLPATRRLAAIGASRSILAWDLDLPADHPIAWLEVVKAARGGAVLVSAGRAPAGPVGQAALKLRLAPRPVSAAASLAAALLEAAPGPAAAIDGFEEFRDAARAHAAAARTSKRAAAEAARAIAAGAPAAVLFDAGSLAGPAGLEVLAWLWGIALLAGARLVPLGRGANERGVYEVERGFRSLAPATGSRELWPGLRAKGIDALYLAGPLPDLGALRPPFLVCQDTHWSRNAERADVVLPAAAFAETGGTWVNTEGRARTSPPAVAAPGAARPDGALVAALAERMGRPGFARRDHAAAFREFCERVPGLRGALRPAGPGEAVFLPGRPVGKARFAPVAPASRRRGRRPGPKAAAGPPLPREILRGLDLAAGSPGFARTRRDR